MGHKNGLNLDLANFRKAETFQEKGQETRPKEQKA